MTLITSFLSSTSGIGTPDDWVKEAPLGDINGSNRVFVLAHSPIEDSETVTINTAVQIITADYTISDKTITFSVAPEVGDVISVTYEKS